MPCDRADLNVEESNLSVQVAALRKLPGQRAIATVPGVGCQFTPERSNEPAPRCHDAAAGRRRGGPGAAPLQAGRLEEAASTLERALAEAPEYAASRMGLANGYWELGRIDEARRFGKRLLEREPDLTIWGTIRDTPFTAPGTLDRMARNLRGIGIPE